MSGVNGEGGVGVGGSNGGGCVEAVGKKEKKNWRFRNEKNDGKNKTKKKFIYINK